MVTRAPASRRRLWLLPTLFAWLLALAGGPRGVRAGVADDPVAGAVGPQRGREGVDWLVHCEGMTREQAVAVGQMLVERNLLHHVLDEHTFHDDALFYRFRADD